MSSELAIKCDLGNAPDARASTNRRSDVTTEAKTTIAHDPALGLRARVALITGAGNGMGRAHALELARRGARVGVLDVEVDAAERTMDEVRAAGGEAIALPADVTAPAAVGAAVERLTDAWGRLDILVSNAGIVNSTTRFLETDPREWHRQFDVHVHGTFHVVSAALPWIERSAAGRIVIVASSWGQVPAGYGYGYCAAKAALINLAKGLAIEFGPKGICVNAIAPGAVETRMLAYVGQQERAKDAETIPAGRYADPSEIAQLVAYLVSDAAAFVMGQVIPINGGELIVGI
jgi:NAD(P)-dependent dehydrogenase (short-subunit alcohol dehydrogenase family)